MAILLVEQYYDFAKSLADRYVVMSRGEVVAKGDGANMDADNVRSFLAVSEGPRTQQAPRHLISMHDADRRRADASRRNRRATPAARSARSAGNPLRPAAAIDQQFEHVIAKRRRIGPVCAMTLAMRGTAAGAPADEWRAAGSRSTERRRERHSLARRRPDAYHCIVASSDRQRNLRRCCAAAARIVADVDLARYAFVQ